MSVTASAKKFDAVKRLTWATMKLITVRCRSSRRVPRFTRRENVINNGRIVASTRNIDDNKKQTALANSSDKVKARTRVADLRTTLHRSQIARINTDWNESFFVEC
jgi:hypothetical protein